VGRPLQAAEEQVLAWTAALAQGPSQHTLVFLEQGLLQWQWEAFTLVFLLRCCWPCLSHFWPIQSLQYPLYLWPDCSSVGLAVQPPALPLWCSGAVQLCPDLSLG